MTTDRGTVGRCIAVAILFTSAPARAEPSADVKAAAEALFDDARELMRDGRFAEACPKLVESQRLDAGVGTLLYLADCYEREDRVASAWATWREASYAARAAAQGEREQLAKTRADALVPALPYLVVVVRAKAPGLMIRRDGVAVAEPLWGTPIPVDPGEHVVDVSADGRVPFRRSVAIAKGERLEVAVPELAPLVAPAAPQPREPARELERPPAPAGFGAPRTVAIGLAGAGVIAIAVGSFFGVRTISRFRDAEAMCPNDRCPDARGKDLADDARRDGVISTIAIAGGAAALAGAAALWLFAPRTKSAARLAPIVAPGGGGVAFGGSL
ncbi:MAG: hypothetical protein KIT84_44305 [Labilithrix sp.]|nr:hypothetical protein [Labilithrix sp.]MCW5818102.1 hypothetical protein [Labilithrix sp.]